MTEVLTLMLLVYPGALVDIFYKLLAKNRFDDSDESEIMKMARYFVMSGGISISTLLCISFVMIPFRQKAFIGIYGALEALKDGWMLIIYVLISTAIALLIAFLRIKLFDRIQLQIKDNDTLIRQLCRHPWKEIQANKEYDWTDVICSIETENGVLRAGLAESLPDDISKTPGIVLHDGDFITPIIRNQRNKDKYISHVLVEYVDLERGQTIKFYKAPKLMELYQE